jgi:hypothetical protein
MKRVIALVALLAGLGVLAKLAGKGPGAPAGVGAGSGPLAKAPAPAADPEAAIRAKYPGDAALVDRTMATYHHNAVAIERTDGRRGLVLLDRLGLEAVFLYEKYPREFRRLRDTLDDAAAADLLLHWREYFALKRAEEADRGTLIAEIARLGPAARRAAAKAPNALPMILAEPAGMTELFARHAGDPEDLRDALVVLSFVSLEGGSADLRGALRTLDTYGPLALEAFRLQGPEGFALVSLHGGVLQAVGDAMPLADALIVLRVNADDLESLQKRGGEEALASALRDVASEGLTATVGGGPGTLRLLAEFGPVGARALRQAGPDAAEVVYGDYPDATLRDQAVAALAEHGPMALAMLAKYAPDPDFREILRRYGPRVIPPVAQSDPAPEALAALRTKAEKSWKERLAQGMLAASRDSGQATIRLIRADGIERVESLNSSSTSLVQFLPMYDLLHLGRVLGRGHTPTTGELAWAVVDGAFVVADVLSLSALAPQGAVAAEAARSELRAASREAVERAGRELTEEATDAAGKAVARETAEASAERVARWWAVRQAGGTYQVLRRLPEALPMLPLPELSRVARPLCARAGLRLSTFAPVRFLRDGAAIVRAIPADRGLKYLGAQLAQASVGVVGLQKMEEHLASRRPAGE